MSEKIQKRDGHLDHEVNCQNCYEPLAIKNFEENLISSIPSQIPSISQEINENKTLITFQCPNCGCILQVKS